MFYNPVETGRRLKELRIVAGYTQEAVAAKLCISLDHYSRTELGKRPCSIDLLCELKVFYNTSMDYLLFGETPTLTPETYDLVVRELKAKLFN